MKANAQYAEDGLDAIAYLESFIRGDDQGSVEILAHCNITGLLDHMAGIIRALLVDRDANDPLAPLDGWRRLFLDHRERAATEVGGPDCD